MSSSSPFALLANATSVPWGDVPEWPMPEFRNITAAELDRGARLCAWFGVPEGDATRVVAVIAFDADNTLAVGRSAPTSGGYPALTTSHPQAHLFERELWEQHGLDPKGHPWLKPVRGSAGGAPAMADFFRVDGREVHEVAVGPVHAGIIEPGHFRFQCAGEEVLHLEIALGYQHRGIERALHGGPRRGTASQMEVACNDLHLACRATAGPAVQGAFNSAMLVSERDLEVQHLLACALKAEMAGRNDPCMHRPDGDLMDLPAINAKEVRHGGSAPCGPSNRLEPWMTLRIETVLLPELPLKQVRLGVRGRERGIAAAGRRAPTYGEGVVGIECYHRDHAGRVALRHAEPCAKARSPVQLGGRDIPEFRHGPLGHVAPGHACRVCEQGKG